MFQTKSKSKQWKHSDSTLQEGQGPPVGRVYFCLSIYIYTDGMLILVLFFFSRVNTIRQYYAPWKVNQRDAAPPGRRPSTQVSYSHDNISQLRLWTYSSPATSYLSSPLHNPIPCYSRLLYYLIREIKTCLNINHITVHNNTYCIF